MRSRLQGNFYLADPIGLKMSSDFFHKEPGESILIEQASAQYRESRHPYKGVHVFMATCATCFNCTPWVEK